MKDYSNIDSEDPEYIEQRNNRKLTADKIKQILSKVLNNPSESAKRWVWELMQNAKDVPNKYSRVSVNIILDSDKLIFRHNGDPFTLSNIFSLIQQVSNKDSTNKDEEVTGKFGTGFITTHLLSEKIDVSGVVLHKGVYRRFKTCLDRSGRTSEEMLPKIDKALEHIRQIENNELFPIDEQYELSRDKDSFDTEFIYYLSSPEKQKAAFSGIEDLINTLPVTLVNIPKIKSVEIVNNIKGHTEYYDSELVFEGDNIKKLKVSILNSSNEKITRDFITYINDDLSLSVEVESFESNTLKEIGSETPKLFRDFPLIGSNKFYFPFMLNGFKFNPTEDRDGILLHGLESLEADENRRIIESAFDAAQEFVSLLIESKVSERYVCALSRMPNEKWEDFSKEWYEKLQESYRGFLLEQELVETDEDCIILRKAIIPTYGSSKESRIGFYKIIKDFVGKNNVPKENIILNWIESTGPKDEIESWNHQIRYELESFLEELQELETIENLKAKLPDTCNVFEWLNNLYEFLHQEREIERFEEFKIIPNHNNLFKSLDELYLEDKNSPIAEEFLDILDSLGDFWRDDLIHRKVKLPTQSVDKRDLSDASEKINESIKSSSLDDEEMLNIVADIIRNEGFNSTGDSFKTKLFKFTKELYKLDLDIRVVENIKGFNFDIAIKTLTDIINRKIQGLETIQELADFVGKDFDSTVIWYNRYFELLENSETFKNQLEYCNIIPNRKGVFCAMYSIYGFGTDENPLNEKLIDILYELDNTEDWKDILLHDGFNLNLETKKFEELGSEIDEKLISLIKEDSYDPGSILPYKLTILDLINWVKTHPEKGEKYLPKTFQAANDLWVKFSMTNEIMELLSDEKSTQLLKQISESNVSLDDLKNLLSIASALDDLGLNGINKILDHANDLLEVEKDFHYLRETGENIEKVFKEALISEGIDIGINHISKGAHDFELYSLADESKKAFVEIKSYRNGTSNAFKFASSQIKKSMNSPDNYFVCMLERPINNEPASLDYLKTNLFYRSNLNNIVSNVITDIDDFERIDNKSGDVKLVLDLRDRPRVHVNYNLMTQDVNSFEMLIEQIKKQLT
jgi:hypothetical protein